MIEHPDGVKIYGNVIIGESAVIEGPCIIGKPARGMQDGEAETVIGDGCHIRPFTTIYAGTRIGDRFQTGQGASIREDNVIGDDVKIGTNAVLEHGNRIGSRITIHSGCFLELTTIEDEVFIGPNVVFVDDPHPPCPDYAECAKGPTVEKSAKIGGNSTILPGIVIGENALVGAGSVVTRNVPPASVVVGNPARVAKTVRELKCNTKLRKNPYLPTTN